MSIRHVPSTVARHDMPGRHAATGHGATFSGHFLSNSAAPSGRETGVQTKPSLTRDGGETRPRGHTEEFGPAGGATRERTDWPVCKLCGRLSLIYVNETCYECCMRDDWRVTPERLLVRGY